MYVVNQYKSFPLTLAIGLLCMFFSSCKKKYETFIPELEISLQAITGESIIWEPNRSVLYWVDIQGKTLFEYDPRAKKSKEWLFNKEVTAVVLESDETVILTLADEIVRFNLTDQSINTLAVLDDTAEGNLRFNDARCGPVGIMWVGTMVKDFTKGRAALYCLSKDGSFEKVLQGVTFSNGIIWSSEGRFMYYNDSPTGKVQRFRYNMKTGDILQVGTAVKVKKGTGYPDGMAVDTDGNLWVAQLGGYGVYCYNPYTGELLAKVELPVPNVTSCTFGGENMETLYITTARTGLTAEELEKYPLSGSVFSCDVGKRGIRPNYFGNENRN